MAGADARRAAGSTRPDERVRGTGPQTSPALDRFGNEPVQGHAQEKRRSPRIHQATVATHGSWLKLFE